MSNKEQKLRNNLYKILTKYLLHDSKNTLHSLKANQESFLDQLAAFRMETTLPIAIKHDVKYQKAQKKCNKAGIYLCFPIFFSIASGTLIKPNRHSIE